MNGKDGRPRVEDWPKFRERHDEIDWGKPFFEVLDEIDEVMGNEGNRDGDEKRTTEI